ncbi:MAG TPA: AMP-binding protein [Candidatus Limnocylindrales bacterium]|nr:AMP-binding protein [Candidatus Limnocylindrales bacterium]
MTFLGLEATGDPAVIDGATGEVTTFRELISLGRTTLQPLGATKALVFLLARNDRFSIAAYAGAVLSGHAVALLDARSTVAVSAEVLATYRPAWIACPTGDAQRLAAAGVCIDSVTPVAGGEMARTPHPGPAQLEPALAVLLSTSGTTGSGKFVRLSERNVDANARAIASCLRLSAADRPVTSLPLAYSFGLSILNSHWVAGAPVVLTDESVMQPAFWEQFRERGCTTLAGVPFTYQMLERIGFRDMELPDLRVLQQAGGALDRRLTAVYADWAASTGRMFFVMYGQTEATARIAFVPPDRLSEKIGSAGVAIPGGRLSIDGGAGGDGDGSGEGEVVYAGPNVMLGYATGSDDLAAGDTTHGVLRTGDIGYLDDDGFLFLTGRSKRIAKVFGLRINLDEVETAIRESGPAAVVGGDDGVWAFCAFGTDDDVAAIGTRLARRFGLHHSAVRFRRVDEIPTTASGKTDYRQVARWIPG